MAAEPTRCGVQPSGGSMLDVAQRRLPALAGRVAAHDLGRRAHEHGVVGELAAHHRGRRRRRCCGRGVVPGSTMAPAPSHEPSPITTGSSAGHCCADRHVGVGVHVVLVGDVAVRARHDVVADHHRPVGDDVAGPTDRAAGADAQHRAAWRPGGSGWPGAMPTERLTWAASSVASPSEMCSSPNTSPGGNASSVPVAEVVVAPRHPVLRPDRAGPLQPAPQAVGRVRRPRPATVAYSVTARWLVDRSAAVSEPPVLCPRWTDGS